MALSYGLTMNTSIINTVQFHNAAANFMVSVERLEQYMHIPKEAETMIEDKRPACNWPDVGKLELNNLKVNKFKNIKNEVNLLFRVNEISSNRSNIGLMLHWCFGA